MNRVPAQIYNSIFVGNGVTPIKAPSRCIFCVNLNQDDVYNHDDLNVSYAPKNCPVGYTGPITYSLENLDASGTTAPYSFCLAKTKALLAARPGCIALPYLIDWHTYAIVGTDAVNQDALRRRVLSMQESPEVQFRVTIRNAGGALSPEVYGFDPFSSPDQLYDYAMRVTRLAVQTGQGAAVCPTMSFRALTPPNTVLRFWSDAEWDAQYQGVLAGGASGIVLFDDVEDNTTSHTYTTLLQQRFP